LDIYVNAQENINSRFNDYVTVYYQWSNSATALAPDDESWNSSSKVIFHTRVDSEVLKTIIGTGNGEMYLHLKAVSSYGKTSISDAEAETGVYDPNAENTTYTPFGPFNFDNAPENTPSIHIDYDYKKRGTVKRGQAIDINTISDTWFIFPHTKDEVVTKIHFAVEALYDLKSKK
jgi:hypothetical protein